MKGVFFMFSLSDNPYYEYFAVKREEELKGTPRDELMEIFKKENERLKPFMNSYENPYMSIHNFKDKMFNMFKKGDEIVIQEKIDGSNSHIRVSEDSFECYSNKFKLNEQNHLQGFWYWCRDHYKDIPDKYWGIDIYGEWLVPHHCQYVPYRYGVFYVFDVMEDGKYWTQDKVERLVLDCGFEYAPVLYKGEFSSWRHALSFVGCTDLGGYKGEGIVIKNQTNLNSTKELFYMKIVDVEFQETNTSRQTIKTVNIDKVIELETQLELTESIVTPARVRKIVLKLIDDNILPPSWGSLNTKDLVKIVKPYVFKDCIKEEKPTVDKVGKIFGKHCNDLVFTIINSLKEGC